MPNQGYFVSSLLVRTPPLAYIEAQQAEQARAHEEGGGGLGHNPKREVIYGGVPQPNELSIVDLTVDYAPAEEAGFKRLKTVHELGEYLSGHKLKPRQACNGRRRGPEVFLRPRQKQKV